MSIAELFTNSIEAADTKYLKKLNRKVLLDSEKAAVEWVLDYEKKYGKVPTMKRIKDDGTHAPYISRVLSGSPLADLFDRANARLVQRFVDNAMIELGEIAHETGHFPVAELKKVYDTANAVGAPESVSILTLDRSTMYSGEDLVDGVDTGIEFIDEMTGGVLAGEVALWVARTGVGKTLIICTQAVRYAQQGKKVLIMSLEMLPKQLSHRIDATLGKFNPRVFRDRRSEALEIRENMLPVVKKELAIIRARGGDIIFTERHIKTVEGLRRAIEEHQPDVVMIDGIYLMELEGKEGRGSASWEKVKSVSNNLKQLAMDTGLPFIETSQFNRQGAGSGSEKRQDLENLGFSDAIAQDADTVVGLYKEPNGNIIAKLLKVRSGESAGECELQLDWSQMEVRSVYHAPVRVVLGGGSLSGAFAPSTVVVS